MIKFLDRKEIDTGRWDSVIAGSPAEAIYGYSWYLDQVAENWSALVVDDYRFVMPLVWKKKVGMKYVYQPFYTQQLGVFGREEVDPALIREMLMIMYRKFRFAGLNLNTHNLVGEEAPFEVTDKSNYVLSLNREYNHLYASYKTNTKRNIRKSLELSDLVDKTISVDELVRLKRENDVIKRSEEDYVWLKSLVDAIMEKGAGKIYSTRTSGEVTAAACFAFSNHRAIYLVSASSQIGKDRRGMFRIVDTFIRDHASSGKILDFEGSNIPSVARFFIGFGARAEIYQGISFTRLPSMLYKMR
ncbi:MAG: hypothetical protein R6W31_03280 [Bacteroidales bacterium]